MKKLYSLRVGAADNSRDQSEDIYLTANDENLKSEIADLHSMSKYGLPILTNAFKSDPLVVRRIFRKRESSAKQHKGRAGKGRVTGSSRTTTYHLSGAIMRLTNESPSQ